MPRPDSGRIESLADFPSRFVSARHIDVQLPEGYGTGKRYGDNEEDWAARVDVPLVFMMGSPVH